MADSSSCLSSFHDLLGEGAAKEVAADWQLQQVTRSHGVARWIGRFSVGSGVLHTISLNWDNYHYHRSTLDLVPCECFTDYTLAHPLKCRGGAVARLSA